MTLAPVIERLRNMDEFESRLREVLDDDNEILLETDGNLILH